MSDWTPPGYIVVTTLVRQHGVNKVRSDLCRGRLQAYRWNVSNCRLDPIKPMEWCGGYTERWLTTAWIPDPHCPGYWVIVRVEDKPKPPPAIDGVYWSPFMVLMLTAVRHFKIGEQQWPKKHELEEYFCAQELPDGRPISPNQARYLATFCRPLAAMSGGNKGG
jgi:hypothetical protein